MNIRTVLPTILAWPLAILCAVPVAAAETDALADGVETAAREVLEASGVPGVSVALVRDGRIVLAEAFGKARIEPAVAAAPSMRFAIGSVSKQFLASLILLLQQDGKLRLDDTVATYQPALTRASEVTIRQLLTHTAGYQDFWPQDYAPPAMLEPITAPALLARWAQKPLDYEPGSRWQYSNTGYVIAGLIAEQAGGKPLFEQLRERIFTPLGMRSASDIDRDPPGAVDPTGYRAYALAPPREAGHTESGWMFAAGGLAMSASDLARWDISLIEQSLLQPASYRALETETLLTDGAGTNYGLGVDVEVRNARRVISHGGEVVGFTAENRVYPDERAALVVLANQDGSHATADLADRLEELLFAGGDSAESERLERAKRIFAGLQQGKIDRSQFTANGNAYFSATALADFRSSLAPLGGPTSFEQTRYRLRGGMVNRVYELQFAKRTLRAWTYEMPDGRLEQFMVAAED